MVGGPVWGGGLLGGLWLLMAVLPVVGAGLLVYVIWRLATNRPVSGPEVFGFYLRAAVLLGVFLTVFGGGEVLKVGLAQAFGDGFSYGAGASAGWSGYSSVTCSGSSGSYVVPGPRVQATLLPGPPARQTPVPFPGQLQPTPIFPGQPLPGPQATVVPGIDHFGPVVNPCRFGGPATPSPETMTARKQSDAIQGGVLLLLGLALVVLHQAVRRRSRVESLAPGVVASGENLVGLGLFFLVALFALLAGLPDSLARLFQVSGADRQAPGAALALGVMALLAWIYYLWVAVKAFGAPATAAPEPEPEPPSDTSP